MAPSASRRRVSAARAPVRLVIVDDHPLWRDMLRKVLERRGLASIVAEASDGMEALEAARASRPDVVIMDIDLPALDGVETTRLLVAERPGVKVLVLSASDERAQVVAAVRAGASGYLLKTSGSTEIADAVRRVHTGELVFPPALASVVLDELRGRDVPAPEGAATDIGNIFVREGDFWTLAFGGEVARARDSKGMRAIAFLLGQPGEEVHASAVAAALEGRPAASRGARHVAEDGLRAGGLGDAGAVLDARAKEAYRQRVRDLDEELAEAEAWNDPERAARAREERDALLRELSSAVGLGGRDRKAASAAERARINVTRRIKAAIAHLERVHPALAAHLAASIRTGTFCSYQPPEATSWRL